MEERNEFNPLALLFKQPYDNGSVGFVQKILGKYGFSRRLDKSQALVFKYFPRLTAYAGGAANSDSTGAGNVYNQYFNSYKSIVNQTVQRMENSYSGNPAPDNTSQPILSDRKSHFVMKHVSRKEAFEQPEGEISKHVDPGGPLNYNRFLGVNLYNYEHTFHQHTKPLSIKTTLGMGVSQGSHKLPYSAREAGVNGDNHQLTVPLKPFDFIKKTKSVQGNGFTEQRRHLYEAGDAKQPLKALAGKNPHNEVQHFSIQNFVDARLDLRYSQTSGNEQNTLKAGYDITHLNEKKTGKHGSPLKKEAHKAPQASQNQQQDGMNERLVHVISTPLITALHKITLAEKLKHVLLKSSIDLRTTKPITAVKDNSIDIIYTEREAKTSGPALNAGANRLIGISRAVMPQNASNYSEPKTEKEAFIKYEQDFPHTFDREKDANTQVLAIQKQLQKIKDIQKDGLILFKPEMKAAGAEKTHWKAQASTPVEKDINTKIFTASKHQKSINEMGTEEINLLADRVFKVLEKRIVIQKDRRGRL